MSLLLMLGLDPEKNTLPYPDEHINETLRKKLLAVALDVVSHCVVTPEWFCGLHEMEREAVREALAIAQDDSATQEGVSAYLGDLSQRQAVQDGMASMRSAFDGR